MKRICSKCGNELKKGEKFCPRCGERCPILEEKEESKKLNKNKFVIAIVIVLLVVIGVSKVHSGKVEKSEKYDEAIQLAQMSQAEEDEKQEIQEQIYQTIDSAILPMTQLTVGQAITTVFSDYDIKWESYDSSNTKYEVTISGSYYPNVEVPEYETQGSIAFVVDIDAGTCEVDQDNDGVYAALLVAAQSY